jgi:hypothetical protein
MNRLTLVEPVWPVGSTATSSMPSDASKRAFNVVDVPFRMGGNENGRGVGERLAIDPNDNDILYFGSRSAGLWMSQDAALTWKRVDSFPAATAPAAPGDAAAGPRRGGGGAVGGRGRGAGLSFVVFDPSTGTRGGGVVSGGTQARLHLF